MNKGKQTDWVIQADDAGKVINAVASELIKALPEERLLSVADVALALQVSAGQIYAWIDEGLIAGVNLSASPLRPYYKVLRTSIVDFINSRVTL